MPVCSGGTGGTGGPLGGPLGLKGLNVPHATGVLQGWGDHFDEDGGRSCCNSFAPTQLE